mgnify:CR=1 FL=1
MSLPIFGGLWFFSLPLFSLLSLLFFSLILTPTGPRPKAQHKYEGSGAGTHPGVAHIFIMWRLQLWISVAHGIVAINYILRRRSLKLT